MGLANTYEAIFLRNMFGKDAAAVIPATYHVGLSTAAVTEAGAATEPSGGSYARVAVTNNTTNFVIDTSVPATPFIKNGTAITFPTATASWGTITHFFIADAASAGNIVMYGTLTNSKVVGIDDVVILGINNLKIYLE
jgi:hypothetical protein